MLPSLVASYSTPLWERRCSADRDNHKYPWAEQSMCPRKYPSNRHVWQIKIGDDSQQLTVPFCFSLWSRSSIPWSTNQKEEYLSQRITAMAVHSHILGSLACAEYSLVEIDGNDQSILASRHVVQVYWDKRYSTIDLIRVSRSYSMISTHSLLLPCKNGGWGLPDSGVELLLLQSFGTPKHVKDSPCIW